MKNAFALASLFVSLAPLAGCTAEVEGDPSAEVLMAPSSDSITPQVKDPRSDPATSCLNGGGAWHVDGYSTSTTTYTDNGVVSYRVCQRTRYSCEGGSYGGALSWSSGGCTDLT